MALNQVGLERLNTATTDKIGESKNILHNGSFIVHQRGGTTTTSGFLLDRWYVSASGGTATFSQGTETSGTVYEKGLANYHRITNTANSTAAGAYRYVRQAIEAQNLLKSGWNYKSASAKITLSFYVRSSVAQNFYGYLRLSDSPDSRYAFETGSLTADTWTKVTKVIPGYASGNIDNDNGSGMEVLIAPFWGTNFTDSGVALNTWAAFAGGSRAPDYANTWAGTNGATFDITGVQLEVGSVATDFEHRSFGQELALCQRYFQIFGGVTNYTLFGTGVWKSSTVASIGFPFMTKMRSQPSFSVTSPTNSMVRSGGTNIDVTSIALDINTTENVMYNANASSGGTNGHGAMHLGKGNTDTTITLSAEL
jgi:hypothetical protein